ncbi:MAG: hypothetical protein LC667_20965 [Thioalkalivibrio sp.]|nr:hypothetical protein [Thioalkalivibrio sp.]
MSRPDCPGRPATTAPAALRGRSDAGFVLALVVLMLFAIAMAGGAGYLVVSAEARMARFSTQGEEAMALARGGLHRFVSEQLGAVAPTAVYAFGGGEAMVVARRVARVDATTDVYFVRSEGSVADPLAAGSPARRVVGAYAYHRKRPLPLHAAVVLNVENFEVDGGATVSGIDMGVGCPGGVAPSIGGAIARDDIDSSGTLTGTPPAQYWTGGYTQFMSQIGLRWDVLRVNGNLNANPTWNGRGVLIVTGRFRSVPPFNWSGIILAGWVDDRIRGSIEGMLVGGFANLYTSDDVEAQGSIRYHSCNVARANEAMSYLELIENTLFELD